MKNALALMALVAVALLACKDSKPAGSCDRRDIEGWESCFDYPESQVASGTQSCAGANAGKWAAAPCNRAGSMGGCKMSSGITKWFFAGTKHASADSAKLECSGSWIDP
jgi:hypothetical protein